MPVGMLCVDTFEFLNVKMTPSNEIPKYLILIGDEARNVGIDAIISLDNFGIICSAIHHYETVKSTVKESIWCLIDHIYRFIFAIIFILCYF